MASDLHITVPAPRRHSRLRASVAGGALTTMLTLGLLVLGASGIFVTGASAAGPTCTSLHRSPLTDCVSTLASTVTADDEGTEEGEGMGEELLSEEGEGAAGEEAASAEVEAEEAENEAGDSQANPDSADTVVLSHLRLTARAVSALARQTPSASAVGFSFTLSAPTTVRVTLVKQVSSAGRKHWATLPDSLNLPLARGRASRSLRGHNRLSAGRYRLTVKPAGGHSHAIYLSARK
jgi:hypothetical protein